MNDGAPTRKEREQQQHHQEILAAAEGLFAELGYHQTTMQMVAERAEFSVGYLYKHFSGKEEMYRELLGFHIQKMAELIKEVEGRDLDPLSELRETYVAICDHFNQHRQFMRIYHEEVAGECSDLHQEKQEHFEDLRKTLKAAQEQGQLGPINVDHLAAAFHGTTRELFARMAQSDEERPFDELPDILFRLFIDPQRP